MGTLGEDIKEAVADVGSEIRIYKASGSTYRNEYIDYDVNIRTSNPFHREFFLESVFPYDTRAEAGDVVEIIESNRKYIVMSRTPSMFENEIIEFDTVIYRCNVSGELFRPSASSPDSQYASENVFQRVKQNCYGLLTESNYDNEWQTNRDFADFVIRELFLYVPAHVGIQTEDRYSPVSGEYYRVGIVRRRCFESTDVAQLHEDNR